jgi:hypothetical protein
MFDIPTNIVIEDRQFNIREGGDYRMVLDCFSILNDNDLKKDERIIGCLMIFYEDFDSPSDIFWMEEETVKSLITEMFRFFNCGQDEKDVKNSPRLINWEKDEQLVCSAVNKVACQEIRAVKYMHWYTFMGYYMAIGESALATVVSIRHKIVKGKKLEKYERDFKNENPQYFKWDRKTVEEHEAQDWVLEMWNNGGTK